MSRVLSAVRLVVLGGLHTFPALMVKSPTGKISPDEASSVSICLEVRTTPSVNPMTLPPVAPPGGHAALLTFVRMGGRVQVGLHVPLSSRSASRYMSPMRVNTSVLMVMPASACMLTALKKLAGPQNSICRKQASSLPQHPKRHAYLGARSRGEQREHPVDPLCVRLSHII